MSRRDYNFNSSPNPKTLYRSRQHRFLGGVCAGMAERYGWDIALVRIATILIFFLLAGPLVLIAYMVAWIIIPLEPYAKRPLSDEEDAFWRDVSDRPNVTFGNLKYTFMDLEDRLQKLERNVTSDDWRLRKQFRDLEGS